MDYRIYRELIHELHQGALPMSICFSIPIIPMRAIHLQCSRKRRSKLSEGVLKGACMGLLKIVCTSELRKELSSHASTKTFREKSPVLECSSHRPFGACSCCWILRSFIATSNLIAMASTYIVVSCCYEASKT